ncbi:hypothetical protein BJ912DRAFT_1018830 [Pholiota molesta]|nr:hypothetical protein BJ912DRAFT_1018830 [Pholiota molesta]
MSFQHFRLGEVSLHQPPKVLNSPTLVPFSPSTAASPSTTKQPYGSGDTDDGYTLIFPNVEAFQAWRHAEEERNCVEFVKGDTHGSKADPPRFRDHTKLVCARHSRSGRKKYVKKHPERVRKVPSRKLDGQGCQASISYKTYFDTEEVRACYIAQHSHEIGPANLPFTRRGRKAAIQNEKERGRNKSTSASDQDQQLASASSPTSMGASQQGIPSSFSSAQEAHISSSEPTPYGFANAIHSFPPNPPPAPPPSQNQPTLPHERWDNMATLSKLVAALETVLIRLYLESPMGVTAHQNINMGHIIQGSLALHNRNQSHLLDKVLL